MTKLSLAGILLIAIGLGLLVVAPVTRLCTTDGDLTTCRLTANVLWFVAGLISIALGSGLAAFGVRATR